MDEERARVVIVDDSESTRQTLEAQLAAVGYDLRLLASGFELLERFGDLQPDLILLDIMMPGLDGVETCRALKAHPDRAHVPVAMVTALTSREDLSEAIAAGADEFISKPVDALELRARCHSLLRIKRQYDALQRAVALRDDLTDMLVHDMRTPLGIILGYQHILELRLSDAKDRRALERLGNAAHDLQHLIDDILTLARSQSTGFEAELERVDLRASLLKICDESAPLAAIRKQCIRVELPEEPVPAEVDPRLWRRLVDNLLANAFKHGLPGRAVVVGLERRGGELVCSVADTGPGVPDALKERIFDKFEVGVLRRSREGHYGIGLAFARMAAQAHGGRIHVEDNAPQGARMVVTLPSPQP